MSAPVDVLAAMRVAEAYCYDAGAANAARNVKASRAAVAELIESMRLIESAKDRGFGIDYARGVAFSALARCKGAQA
jgi:hypothetical protein